METKIYAWKVKDENESTLLTTLSFKMSRTFLLVGSGKVDADKGDKRNLVSI